MLAKNDELCYNAFDALGKQVKILYEPVAVRCVTENLSDRTPQSEKKSLERSEKTDEFCIESKYPASKKPSTRIASADPEAKKYSSKEK